MSGFGYAAAGGACKKSSGPSAVVPVIAQANYTIASGAGAAFTDLLAPLAADACAVDAGHVHLKGCYAVRFEITYVKNPNLCDADGNGCSDSAIVPVTTEVKTYDVPVGGVMALPGGLVKGIKVQTLDKFGGAPLANTSDQTVLWTSSYQPDACGCVKIPA